MSNCYQEPKAPLVNLRSLFGTVSMGPLGNAVSSKNGHDINPLDEVLLVRNAKESLFVPLGKQESSNVVFDGAIQGPARYDQTHRRPEPVPRPEDLPRGDGGDGSGDDNDQGGNPFAQNPAVQNPEMPEMLEMYRDLQRRNADLAQAASQLDETQRQNIIVLTQRVEDAIRNNQLQQVEYNKLYELYKQAREQLLMTLEDKQSEVMRRNTVNALRRMDKILVLFKNIERRDEKRSRAAFGKLRDFKRTREIGTQMRVDAGTQVDAVTQMGTNDMGTQMEVEPSSSSTDRRGIAIVRRRIQEIQRKVFSRLARHSQNQRVLQLEEQVFQVVQQADQALESQDRQQIIAARENALQVENIAVQNFQGNIRAVSNIVGASMERLGDALGTGLRILGAGAEAASGPLIRSTTRAVRSVATGAGSALASGLRASGEVAYETLGTATVLSVDAVAGAGHLGRDMERGGGNFIQNATQYVRNAAAGFGGFGLRNRFGRGMIGAPAPNNTAAPNPRLVALGDAQYDDDDDEALALGDAQYDDEPDDEAAARQAAAQQAAAQQAAAQQAAAQAAEIRAIQVDQIKRLANLKKVIGLDDLTNEQVRNIRDVATNVAIATRDAGYSQNTITRNVRQNVRALITEYRIEMELPPIVANPRLHAQVAGKDVQMPARP
jgi:hypothetical protein